MKQFTGIVVANNLQRTLKVEVKTVWAHPVYKKTISKTKRYLVDDQEGKAKVGDTVTFKESRPISKRKRFTLVKITK